MKTTTLDSAAISAFLRQAAVHRLTDLQGTYIFAGSKTEMINMNQAGADLTNSIGR